MVQAIVRRVQANRRFRRLLEGLRQNGLKLVVSAKRGPAKAFKQTF